MKFDIDNGKHVLGLVIIVEIIVCSLILIGGCLDGQYCS